MTKKKTYKRKSIRKNTSNNIENSEIQGMIFGRAS